MHVNLPFPYAPQNPLLRKPWEDMEAKDYALVLDSEKIWKPKTTLSF